MLALNRIDGSSTNAVPRKPVSGLPIPGHDTVFYNQLPIYVTTFGGLLSCQNAQAGGGNGAFLYGEDDRITLADLNTNSQIVVSNNYSGCIFKVFRTGSGNFVCMHIYNSRRQTDLMRDADRYVEAQGGTEVATIGSANISGTVLSGGVDSVWFICEMITPFSVGISRIQVDGSGHAIRQDSGVYPGVNFDLLTTT